MESAHKAIEKNMTSKADGGAHLFHFEPKKFQDPLLSWYEQNKSRHPWRMTWDQERDPYPVWLSEIMLQQTTLAAMIPVYERFLYRFPTVYHLANAKEDDLKKTVQGLGYYRRFSLLHKGAQHLLSSKTAEIAWPRSYEEWLEIPGVGDYTAAALASITLNEAVPVIDGNVIRILCRIFDIRKSANDPSLKKELKALGYPLVSSSRPGDFNQGLMELGQKLCRPLRPNCVDCPLGSLCLAKKNESVHLAPAPKLKKEPKEVHLRLHIFEKKNAYALFERLSTSKFLRGTSGFLTEIGEGRDFKIDGLKESERIGKGSYLGMIKHTITHHKIRGEVFLCSESSPLPGSMKLRWVKKSEVGSQLVSSLDIKAWHLLQKETLGRLL